MKINFKKVKKFEESLRYLSNKNNNGIVADMFDNAKNIGVDNSIVSSSSISGKTPTKADFKCNICGHVIENFPIRKMMTPHKNYCPVCGNYPRIFKPEWNSLKAWCKRKIYGCNSTLLKEFENATKNNLKAESVSMCDKNQKLWWKNNITPDEWECSIHDKIGFPNKLPIVGSKHSAKNQVSFFEKYLVVGLSNFFSVEENHTEKFTNCKLDVDLILRNENRNIIGLIEVDGKFHRLEKAIERDKKRDKLYKERFGLNIFHLIEMTKEEKALYKNNCVKIDNDRWLIKNFENLDTLKEALSLCMKKFNVKDTVPLVSVEEVYLKLSVIENSLWNKYPELVISMKIDEEVAKRISPNSHIPIKCCCIRCHEEWFEAPPYKLTQHKFPKRYCKKCAKVMRAETHHKNYLLKHPENSFGKVYHNELTELGINPDTLMDERKIGSKHRFVDYNCPFCHNPNAKVNTNYLHKRFEERRKNPNKIFGCLECSKLRETQQSSTTKSLKKLLRNSHKNN